MYYCVIHAKLFCWRIIQLLAVVSSVALLSFYSTTIRFTLSNFRKSVCGIGAPLHRYLSASFRSFSISGRLVKKQQNNLPFFFIGKATDLPFI